MTATHAAAVSGRTKPVRRRPRVTLVFLSLVLGVAAGRFVLFQPTGTDGQLRRSAQAPTAARAVEDLERAVRRDPEDARGWQRLGGVYLRQATLTADPSYYDLSDRALDRADALVPDQDEGLITRGALALSRHEFDAALKLATRVHDRNPSQPDALAVIVDAEVELGRYDAATTHLQELLDRRPGVAAYSRVSYLRELYGDFEGATVAMRQAGVAGGSPFELATIATFLGDLALNQGDVDGAAAEYGRALNLQPDLPLARLGTAKVWAARDELRRAIETLDRLTRRVPVSAAVTLLAELQALEGRETDAARSITLVRSIAKLQQAAGQVTDLEMAVFEADHADGLEQAAKAVDLARRAFAARPDNVYAADALGWALYRAGDALAAQPFVEQALRLGTDDALVRYHAAQIFDAAGQTDQAREQLTAALSRNPWFSFRHRADAIALAARLTVPVPMAWSAP